MNSVFIFLATHVHPIISRTPRVSGGSFKVLSDGCGKLNLQYKPRHLLILERKQEVGGKYYGDASVRVHAAIDTAAIRFTLLQKVHVDALEQKDFGR
ncbi:hypothetical protein MRX96_017335 [Rhipicephalus microplus]